jgi:hypothetical protein
MFSQLELQLLQFRETAKSVALPSKFIIGSRDPSAQTACSTILSTAQNEIPGELGKTVETTGCNALMLIIRLLRQAFNAIQYQIPTT